METYWLLMLIIYRPLTDSRNCSNTFVLTSSFIKMCSVGEINDMNDNGLVGGALRKNFTWSMLDISDNILVQKTVSLFHVSQRRPSELCIYNLIYFPLFSFCRKFGDGRRCDISRHHMRRFVAILVQDVNKCC